jgi:hypothetical protein
MNPLPAPHRPGLEPAAVPLTEPVLRLRPRRAWLPRAMDAGASPCGWFESSRELAEGLEVTEFEWDGAPAWTLND